jgi:hypothetical protein
MSSTLEAVTTGSAVGALLPLLTAIVQQPQWPARGKKIVATLVAILGGLVTVASVGGLEQFQHGVPTLGTMAAVLAVSQSTYDLIWKPSRIAPAIEAATNPRRRAAAG